MDYKGHFKQRRVLEEFKRALIYFNRKISLLDEQSLEITPSVILMGPLSYGYTILYFLIEVLDYLN